MYICYHYKLARTCQTVSFPAHGFCKLLPLSITAAYVESRSPGTSWSSVADYWDTRYDNISTCIVYVCIYTHIMHIGTTFDFNQLSLSCTCRLISISSSLCLINVDCKCVCVCVCACVRPKTSIYILTGHVYFHKKVAHSLYMFPDRDVCYWVVERTQVIIPLLAIILACQFPYMK